MDFGRAPVEELDQIDFRLAAEPAFNKTILRREPAKDPKVYIGCASGAEQSGWERYIRRRQKKKISWIIMCSITTVLN